ncbi:MAG TPA: GntR family transcriptional regulator [Polyangiaceae bacterium]|nr:GntR family transcriptional regulator [Polyangiaceae bacterium]
MTSSLLNIELDRASPIPLYFQVARQIEQAIERGDLVPGGRLENEIELADRLGLSRPTMRRAIQELVSKGLLVRRRGIGTQIVHGQVKRRVELTSLHDDLARGNQHPTTRVLEHETIAASDDIAVALGVPPGSAVVSLKRVRYAQKEPLAILRNWLPASIARFSTQELEERGLYALLRSTGVQIRIASQRIGARTATPEEAKQLRIKRGAAVLTMERTAYGDSGSAVEFGAHVYRSDNYSFEITLVERS